ncbi:hypothetical protein EMEDMD4_10172 [Sinorhizobium medicae]|uniref:Uncharacterized protein n=1 Tax=Sinorhizobium medicae TaxID=110321 RepID=A0A508WSI5_9HYPH|nr:hypothetical protein EMEDMD4_10172 [Sinorhizobium medicae]
MTEVIMQILVDPLLVGENHAAEAATLAIDMFRRGIDDDMGAELQRLLEERRCEDVVDHHLGADLIGEPGDTGNVDHFQRRVRRAFQEEDLCVRTHCVFPVLEIAAVHQRALDPVFRRQRLHNPAARAEECAGGDDMVSSLHLAKDCRRNRGHAGGGCTRVFRSFEHAHALFEHVVGRAAVTRIDVTVSLALETGLRRFGGVVDEALRQEDRFGGLAVLGTQRSAVDELGCRAPILAHEKVTFKNKKTGRETTGLIPGLFSYLFNVAASRPAKSPRDKAPILPGCACVNSRSLVLSGN